MSLLHRARQAFYNADGPYRRARVAEALGSTRWSRPALREMDVQLDFGDGSQIIDKRHLMLTPETAKTPNHTRPAAHAWRTSS